MSTPGGSSGQRPEAWFLTNELEGERAGGFRQERWCRFFLEAGFDIRIFNLRGAFDCTEFACSSLAAFDAFRRERLAHAPPVSSLREGAASRIGRWFKHLLMADLYLPNVVGLLRRTRRLLAESERPVVVMASSPTFSVAVVGALLKARFAPRVRLAIDMRDAWAQHNALGGLRPVKLAIEGRTLRRADDVMTVSHWLADEFSRAHGIRVRVMYNVATHYLDQAPAEPVADWSAIHPAIRPERLKIVYTGSTPRGHYDVDTFAGAVAALRAQDPSAADRLQFIFVGACSAVEQAAARRAVAAGDIVFVPHLPHKLVRRVQAGADVLLFYAHHGEGNKGVVSTKLFEYLSLGQPLLPICLHRGSDVDQLLRRFCTGSINVHSAPEMTAVFARVAQDGPAALPRRLPEDRTPELLQDYASYVAELADHARADR